MEEPRPTLRAPLFVRITIVPSLDTAIVVASNSGDAGAATREVTNSVLAETAASGTNLE